MPEYPRHWRTNTHVAKSASQKNMTRRRGSCGSKWKTFSGCVLAKGFKEGGKVAEYNLLTQAFWQQDTPWTISRQKVRLPGGCYGKSPLENIYGGFEYVRGYSDNFVYKTGCGLYVKGRNVIGNMSTAGIDWCYENDNPVIRCPYDKPDCPQNDPKLYGTQGGGLCIQCWCVCHRTKDDYSYKRQC